MSDCAVLCMSGQIAICKAACSGPIGANQASDQNRTLDVVPSEMRRRGKLLERGTALTRQGRFKEAIPHLLAAQGRVANEYALEFNLSLCYVGLGEYKKAISFWTTLTRAREC